MVFTWKSALAHVALLTKIKDEIIAHDGTLLASLLALRYIIGSQHYPIQGGNHDLLSKSNNDVLFDIKLQFHIKTLQVLLHWYTRGIVRLLYLENCPSF